MSEEVEVLDDIEEFDDDLIESEGFEDVLEDEKEEDENEIVPPPADNKNRVVAQLDEVTKESEEKASQILDIMDEVSETIEENTSSLKDVLEFLKRDKTLLETLHQKFPNINIFKNELSEIEKIIKTIENIIETNETTSEKIFTVMDIMQYQDIHRQKIERVINIMRALIKYMNKLFEGQIEDEKRAKSANYIHGDENEEVLSDDDIESLLEQFGV